jgi:hypothetical protein
MAKPKLTTYRNNGGHHLNGEGVTIKSGEVFKDADPNLMEKFPAKFEKVAYATPEPADEPEEPTGAGTPNTTTKPASKQADEPTDVTDEFPAGKEAGLTVSKVKAGWNVYDPDEGEDPEPLNDKPLKKRAVEAFIDTYLEED